MICVLEMDDGEIVGWIIGTDEADIARQAYSRGLDQLASFFYTSFEFPPGKHVAPSGHIVLVQ